MSQLNRNACTRCQIQFPSAIEHVAHMRRSNNHHLCQLCNNAKDFETFYEFREHVKSAHLGCIICAWNAPSPLGLTQHIMAVHNMCPECEGHFPTAHEQQGVSPHTPSIHFKPKSLTRPSPALPSPTPTKRQVFWMRTRIPHVIGGIQPSRVFKLRVRRHQRIH